MVPKTLLQTPAAPFPPPSLTDQTHPTPAPSPAPAPFSQPSTAGKPNSSIHKCIPHVRDGSALPPCPPSLLPQRVRAVPCCRTAGGCCRASGAFQPRNDSAVFPPAPPPSGSPRRTPASPSAGGSHSPGIHRGKRRKGTVKIQQTALGGRVGRGHRVHQLPSALAGLEQQRGARAECQGLSPCLLRLPK